eukprot:4035224-Amphidinium_carterae.1
MDCHAVGGGALGTLASWPLKTFCCYVLLYKTAANASFWLCGFVWGADACLFPEVQDDRLVAQRRSTIDDEEASSELL